MKDMNFKTPEELIQLKESLNKVIENKIERYNNTHALNTIKELDFGSLKYLFENMLTTIYENKGDKTIASYVKLIKENKSLRNGYKLFNTLKEWKENVDADTLLNTALKLRTDIKENDLKSLRKLVYETAKKNKLSSEDIENIMENYHNSIDYPLSYIITEKQNFKNLSLYTENYHKVTNFLKEEKNSTPNTVKESKELMDELTNILSEDMNKWEKDVINDISRYSILNKSNEELFEDYKKQCINILDETIENVSVEESSRFILMKEGLSNKQYDANSFVSDILKLSELKATLSE